MTNMAPQVACPLKGALSDFMGLDVELTRNLPFSAALQHLAQCITQPEWLTKADRSSGALHVYLLGLLSGYHIEKIYQNTQLLSCLICSSSSSAKVVTMLLCL